MEEPDLSSPMQDYDKDKNLGKFIDALKISCGLMQVRQIYIYNNIYRSPLLKTLHC
jgi:hypothetical protein